MREPSFDLGAMRRMWIDWEEEEVVDICFK